MKKLRVIELFAGVGGFSLGLVDYNGKSDSSNYKKNYFKNISSLI
jgi:DNA (cytosine-5)-methyltransferase 1